MSAAATDRASDPTLSVVVVAYRSRDDLTRTLPPLIDQLRVDDELIVVDNAGEDGLSAELAALAPGARLITPPGNVGFAAGANAGAAAATGELLVLLNPDAVAAPGFVEAIRRPWGGAAAAWMGLVTLAGGSAINTSGGVLHFTGFGWAGQVGEPVADGPGQPREVGFLSGACLALPREQWLTLGGLAEPFFMYCEDVDLSLRVRLRGGALVVVPDARVDHDYEFAKGGLKWRMLERNRWATIVRTYPTPLLVAVTPALLAAEPAVWVMAARGGWLGMKALATLDLVRALPRLLRERRRIQASATITPQQFASQLVADLDSPYFGRLGRHPLVIGALRLYWRGVLASLGG